MNPSRVRPRADDLQWVPRSSWNHAVTLERNDDGGVVTSLGLHGVTLLRSTCRSALSCTRVARSSAHNLTRSSVLRIRRVRVRMVPHWTRLARDDGRRRGYHD